jgi:pimeloyl-ACP methyl ester carboxylesterase
MQYNGIEDAANYELWNCDHMAVKTALLLSDVRGYSRLAIDATLGVTDIVEAVHANILRAPGQSTATHEHLPGLPGLIYNNIRGVTRLVGTSLDALLALLDAAFEPAVPEGALTDEREALRAAVNGVLGDYLVDSANPLAIPMQLRRDGQPLDLTRVALATALPHATGKIVVLAHGLCMNDRQWRRNEHDHGAALAADAGFTPVYLHYNSGLHTSTNGRALAGLLEELLHTWPVPVEELVIIGHSMGGLVTRSACYYGAAAGHMWLDHLRKIVFLGTPHHGTPFERGGNWVTVGLGVSRYSAAFARLGKIRSAGITDLRYGSVLEDDWVDRDRFAHANDLRRSVPLPVGVQCYVIGAAIATGESMSSAALLGDGLVPLHSALGEHTDPARNLSFPESHRWIGYGLSHWDLLDRREVYEQIRLWLAD